jgi:plastocyanin
MCLIHTRAAFVAVTFMLAATACGGGGNTVTQPTTPTPTGGNTAGPTVTIANNAVSPKNITVARGTQVTFVNNDAQPHDVESDPHPIHTDCPEINQVGLLTPGQRKQTGILNTVRVCGYHDHNRDTVESLQGTITIQ